MTPLTFVQDINESYDSYQECCDDLVHKGYRHLGWLNSGVYIPKHYKCSVNAYSNQSGSSCIYVDPIHRVFYSVDMGD